MKTYWLVVLVVVVGLLILGGCGGHNGQVPPGPIGALFVGSDACRLCHPGAFNDWKDSGHPWKLTKTNGQPVSFPFSNVPNTPPGTTWADTTYIIGGYAWKARWTDLAGYIITGNTVQYNLETGGFSKYEADVPNGTKPYDCGACHTTGWTPTGPDGPHQDDLPGMHGTFNEAGIGCEACHGPGSKHVTSTSAADIVMDPSAELCGRCHTRDASRRPQAKDGFIQHHEQYDEMIQAGHVGLQCLDCHDSHRGSIYQNGIVRDCAQCHPYYAEPMPAHPALTECEDCHMPEATKNAVATNAYNADDKTHIFKINTDPVGKDAMFFDDGGKTFARGFVTLDFACYSCHQDPSGVGGPGSIKTLDELSAAAQNMHGIPPASAAAQGSRFRGLKRGVIINRGNTDDPD